MVAFAAEHWFKGYRDDPRYIQWAGAIETQTDGVYSVNYYPLHQCSDEEFDRFWTIED